MNVFCGRSAAVIGLLLLAGCGSNPVPPEWKTNTQSALESYERAYLDGRVASAETSFGRARAEAARTGQPAWVARVELVRCATRAAALEFDDCPAYAALRDGATPEEESYAAFVTGDWKQVDGKRLPPQYGPLLKEGPAALPTIEDPLSRLIAAGVLFRRGAITPDGIATAIDTASERGWRRPLLAWLGVQLKRAEAAGDESAVASLRRRIGLVESSVGP
jgi:hypothetical protein